MAKNKYSPNFHCINEAQKKAIRASYARKKNAQKQNNFNNQRNTNTFKLPLKEGGHRWNIYRVPNFILNGKQDGNVHGGLVLDEDNNNVMLVEVTHSMYKKKNRKNLKIRNLNSNDLDKNGELKNSYLEKRLIVSVTSGGVEKGIEDSVLYTQLNDLNFSEEEKQRIIDELSNLTTAEDKYNLFKKLAKEKANK